MVFDWSVDQVETWIGETLELECCREVFRANKASGRTGRSGWGAVTRVLVGPPFQFIVEVLYASNKRARRGHQPAASQQVCQAVDYTEFFFRSMFQDRGDELLKFL